MLVHFGSSELCTRIASPGAAAKCVSRIEAHSMFHQLSSEITTQQGLEGNLCLKSIIAIKATKPICDGHFSEKLFVKSAAFAQRLARISRAAAALSSARE